MSAASKLIIKEYTIELANQLPGNFQERPERRDHRQQNVQEMAMPVEEPDLRSVEQSVIDLLFEEEVASLATLSESGYPSASAMHIASDRLVVYAHTFVQYRKYTEMLRDPRVSYVVSHLPARGFDDRRQIRSLQVKGRAELVTSQEELEHAVHVSRQQFAWLQKMGIFDNIKIPDERTRQVFFRINPVEAVWADHRVHPLWRMILTFTPDGHQVATMRPYNKASDRTPVLQH